MKINFDQIRERVFGIFATRMDPLLTYHNIGHTQDVLVQAQRIAWSEGIRDTRSLLLLKIAALYHDIGFLYKYMGHEEESCAFVEKDLVGLSLKQSEIKMICSMIMSTRIPQSPKTHLEQVLCDADLDYLGRDDFPAISNSLRLEFLRFKIVKDESEWEERQIRFINDHKYFTATSAASRERKKQLHLGNLKVLAGMITN